MKILGVESSATSASVSVVENGKVIALESSNTGLTHSQTLMPMVESTLKKADTTINDIDYIAVSNGPGSFTGIRIGVSTIKALCLAYDKKAVAVTSFDTIAYNKKDDKVLAVINAGHGGYYACGYNNGKVEIEPCYILAERLQELEKDYKILGFENVEAFSTQVVDNVEGLKLAVDDKASELIDADILCPLYVRKSQAEEGRK